MTIQSFASPGAGRILDSVEETAQRISELGGHIRKSGKQWVIQCPHPDHADINPSATLARGDHGQALLHCFACSESNSRPWLDAVNQRLIDGTPFTAAELGTRNSSGLAGKGERVAEYAYFDGQGRRFTKVRYETESSTKSFEWFREINGARVSGLGRMPIGELLPYGSEHLTGDEDQILWVEGEKDANRARASGFAALTSGAGASGPLPADLSCAVGREVVIVADNDLAGIRYAKRVQLALEGIAESVRIALPQSEIKGADLSDHLEAGLTLAELRFEPQELTEAEVEEDRDRLHRQVVLTKASEIQVRPVTWLWQDRLAEGSLSLLAGREGQGKSTVAAWLIGSITRGTLPGAHLGTPKSVFVSASEDSWESTVVPRLIAADADLDRVFRVEVVTTLGAHGDLSMPVDIPQMTEMAQDLDVALLVLDPLLSRIASNIDTHRDAEVRQALEPLAVFANSTKITVVGLAHFNKTANADPLNAVMASKAFTAVARSVHTVVRDIDDETTRYFGTAKNNLGRDDLPVRTFTIEAFRIPVLGEEIWTSKVIWGDDVHESVRELMARSNDPTDRTAAQEAADWLEDYLFTQGGQAASAEIKKAGRTAGHSVSALHRAKLKLGLSVKSQGFPRETVWLTASTQESQIKPLVVSPAGALDTTETTGTTEATGTTGQGETFRATDDESASDKSIPRAQLFQSSQSSQPLASGESTCAQTSVLFCGACGGVMVEDFFGNGLHVTCMD